MPLVPLQPSNVNCPHCGAENQVFAHKHLQWLNGYSFLEQLLRGEMNTFTCTACGRLGWVNRTITIFLDGSEKLYFQPVPPDVAAQQVTEEGALVFKEPLGQPLSLLSAYIHEYNAWWDREGWQIYHQTKLLATLARELD